MKAPRWEKILEVFRLSWQSSISDARVLAVTNQCALNQILVKLCEEEREEESDEPNEEESQESEPEKMALIRTRNDLYCFDCWSKGDKDSSTGLVEPMIELADTRVQGGYKVIGFACSECGRSLVFAGEEEQPDDVHEEELDVEEFGIGDRVKLYRGFAYKRRNPKTDLIEHITLDSEQDAVIAGGSMNMRVCDVKIEGSGDVAWNVPCERIHKR